jgi:hypothetical protein
MDGGVSDALPVCTDDPQINTTITVSPFSGIGVDISPGHATYDTDRPALNQWMRYDFSLNNVKALLKAALPRSRKSAEDLFKKGKQDGEEFLKQYFDQVSKKMK